MLKLLVSFLMFGILANSVYSSQSMKDIEFSSSFDVVDYSIKSREIMYNDDGQIDAYDIFFELEIEGFPGCTGSTKACRVDTRAQSIHLDSILELQCRNIYLFLESCEIGTNNLYFKCGSTKVVSDYVNVTGGFCSGDAKFITLYDANMRFKE